jgi:hypothetical protein
MVFPLVLAAFLAAFFYLGLPAVGAFAVRSRWRAFRRRMKELSLNPIAGYGAVSGSGQARPGEKLGEFRFFGGIEAIGKEEKIWIRNEDLSLAVDMSQAQIYSLPMGSTKEEGPDEENDIVFPDDMPERILWSKLVSVPEKTKIFVGGSLFVEEGLGVFKAERDSPLIVVLYEGAEETILRRAIWSGRQSNEYWNKVTPVSMSAGVFVMIILFFSILRRPILSTVAFLIGASASLPLIPFLPPGAILLILYRALWRRGRILRAERDTITLPMRYFPESERAASVRLPDGELYGWRRMSPLEDESLPDGIRIRGAEAFSQSERPDFYTVFGALQQGKIVRPKDPMADFVAVVGDPARSSEICSRKARTSELVSGSCVLAATLANGFIFWFVYRAMTG